MDLIFEEGKASKDLNPREGTLWENNTPLLSKSLDKLPIKSGEKTQFLSHLTSEGIFRFNVLLKDNSIQTLYLDKLLHTTLLRKNFLRKLGFKIPAIKYLKKVQVDFKSLNEKKIFIEKLRNDTVASEKRWIEEQSSSELSLVLRDLAAIELETSTPYNLAMGVPSGGYEGDYLDTRVLRSVLLVYSICDLQESVNKFPWKFGRTDEGDLLLPNFFSTFNNFTFTNINDLRWLGERIKKISRKDFVEIVQESYFPLEVGALLFQKILSRTVGILEDLGLELDADIQKKLNYTYEPKVNFAVAKNLEEGRITKIDWTDEGYATRFASEIKPGPFKDAGYYFLSLLQSISFDSITSAFNKKLQAFDPNKARLELAEKEFRRGLNAFVQRGEIINFPVSNWRSPLFGVSVILSRNVVLGNYLGTDGRIQMADTFGFVLSPGYIIGFENVDYLDNVSLQFGLSEAHIFTHLKPLNSMKSVFKESYRNLMVSLLKKDLRKTLAKFSNPNVNLEANETSKDELKNKLDYFSKLVSEIDKILGVGESLLITKRVALNSSARAKLPLPLVGPALNLDLGIGVSKTDLKRLHLYRKSTTIIEIYDDLGNARGERYSIALENKIPIIRFEHERRGGDYSINSYSLNIDSNIQRNPSLVENAKAFEALLFDSSTELLDRSKKISLEAVYKDRYNRLSFLIWRKRFIKGLTRFKLKTTFGVEGDFVSFAMAENSGKNWESFLKDAINFKLQDISADLEWENNIWARSSDSFLGSGTILEYNYEAQIEDGDPKNEYMLISKSFKGWSKSNKKLIKKIEEVNEEYGFKVFKIEDVFDISKLSLYNIEVRVHIYDEGLKSLKNISIDQLKRMAIELEKNKCVEPTGTYTLSSGKKIPTCGYLLGVINKKRFCEKLEDLNKKSRCWAKYTKSLFKKIGFSKFHELLGDKLYIEGRLEGYRNKSEVALFEDSNVIRANSLGRKDPRYPYGILNSVSSQLGLSQGEFSGFWLRDRI